METQIIQVEQGMILAQEQYPELTTLLSTLPAVRSLLAGSALYCREQNLKSEIDCFHSTDKTLGFIERNYPGAGLSLIGIAVCELADSFNIGKNMSAPQVIDTSRMLMMDYPELKLSDVAFCFNKIKKGHYGKIYDRMDSAIIFECIEKFLADKHEQIDYFWKYQQKEIKSKDETLLIVGPSVDPVDDKVAVEYIKEIRKKVIAIQRRNYKAKKIIQVKPPENTIYQVHQEFIRNFQMIYEAEIWENPEKAKGPKFIDCCGKRLDIGEYIQKKHMQLVNYYRKVNYYFGIHDPNYPAYVAPPMPNFSEEQPDDPNYQYYQMFKTP